MTSSNRPFRLIFSTLLIDVAAMGMLIPVLPAALQDMVGGDVGRAATIGGLFAALSALLSFVCAPVLGAISDRVGRRPVLLLGMAGPAVTYFGLAVTTDLTWFVVGFCLSGILGAIHSTTNAYIADITPAEERAGRFGLMGAAFGIGFVFGPLAGGLLGGLGTAVPFYVAGGLTVINIVICLIALPESLPSDRRRRVTLAQANPIAALRLLVRTPLLTAMAAAFLLTNVANHALYSTWVFSTTTRFGWSSVTTGIVFAVMGMAFAVAQGLAVGPTVKRLGERRSILLGLTVSVAAFAAYAVAPEGWMIYVVIAVSAFGAVDEPAIQSLLSQAVGADEQGALQGALASVMGLAAVLGPLVGSTTFGYFVSDAAPVYLPGAPFAAGAVLIVAALALAWRFIRPVSSISVPDEVSVPQLVAA